MQGFRPPTWAACLLPEHLAPHLTPPTSLHWAFSRATSNHGARRLGNAALDGAAAIALHPALLGVAREFGSDVDHIDLASDASFNAAFISATEFAPYLV